MLFIGTNKIKELAPPLEAVNALQLAFTRPCEVPVREFHETGNAGQGLLVMPAWGYEDFLGVKLVTVNPDNPSVGRPYIQGLYTLFDSTTGAPLALFDAPSLTNVRTAAASALASSYLSRDDANTLLILGSGSLAPYLIEAHSTVRPLRNIFIWSRTYDHAKRLADRFDNATPVRSGDDLRQALAQADIISSATPSEQPLVGGEELRPGQHLDLVGGYKPSMREVDDLAINRSRVFIDTNDALEEAGDLIIPMKRGTWRKKLVQGTLEDLCSGRISGRKSADEITLFKSVGHALEDISVAVLIWQHLQEGAGGALQ